MRDPTTLFRGSPARANRTNSDSSMSPFTSSSNLFQEISTLRSRLRELEDDTKSSVAGGLDEQDSQSSNMIRKEIAQLEQEKATLEKDFLNQMSSLAGENQKRLVDLQTRLAESETENHELKEKLLIAEEMQQKENDGEKEQLLRMLDEQKEKHSMEIEQMKLNLASTDMEITESRGEIDQLHEQLEELQTHRETLIEEVTSCRMELTEEQRKLSSMKSDFTMTKLTVEKLHTELKHKDEKIQQKMDELEKMSRKVDELKGCKKELADAAKIVEQLEKDIKARDTLLEQRKDEIGEMNDTIIHLQDHKEMLVSEVTDLRMELQKLEANSSPRLSTAPTEESEVSSFEKSIKPAEKQKLEGELNQLEERLRVFQKKLSEKEDQIESLSNALTDEKRTNKRMKAKLNAGARVSPTERDLDSVIGEKDHRAEISFLRNQNKILNDEVRSLRNMNTSGNVPSIISHATVSSQDSKAFEHRNKVKTSSSRNMKLNASIPENRDTDEISVCSSISSRQPYSVKASKHKSLTVVVPSSNAEASSKNSNTPRTPVSGLVASFEKRIANKKPISGHSCDSDAEESLLPSLEAALEQVDFRQELESEKTLTCSLEKQLLREKETVTQLKAKLAKASEESCRSQNPPSSDLSKKLQQSQYEARKLQIKVAELEDAKKRNQDELDKLRSEMVYNDVEREDLEKKVQLFEQEMKRFNVELERSSQRKAFEDEKKDDEISSEIQFLQNVVKEKDETLSHLRAKLQQEEELNDDKNFRLRTQLLKKDEEHKEMLSALSKEVEQKDNEIALLQAEIAKHPEDKQASLARLHSDIISLEGQLQDACNMINDRDAKIDRLENDWTELVKQTSAAAAAKGVEYQNLVTELNDMKEKHKEIDAEYAKSVKALEDKIFSMELSLADLGTEKENLKTALEAAEHKMNTEISPQLQKQIDEDRESLTVELAKTQMKHAELEMEHTNRVNDLEGSIKVLEAKLQTVEEEKHAAQAEFEDLMQKSEVEASPKVRKVHDSEINRITVELTKTQIKQADLEREYSSRIKDLEMEIEDLEVEAEEELKQKDKEIEKLRRDLEAKEDEIQRLELDRSQLCTSMNDMSTTRNDELHELQAEIIDLSTKTKSQEREIHSLKMKLQDYENIVDGTAQKYENRIKDLEEELSDIKQLAKNMVDQDSVAAVKSENMKLRECVRELKADRRSLSERLEVLMSERNGSKSTQILQKRNLALKDEVEKLTKRLKKLEASITRFAI